MEDAFRLFGLDHLAALATIGAVAVGSIAAARRGRPALTRSIRWLLAAALASAHLTETLVAVAQGWYQRQMLPLELCDLAAMLAVYGLASLDRRAIEPLYFFALSGTLPALVTPELDVGFPRFRFVVYFLEHGLTVAAPLFLVGGLGIRPRRGAWLRALVLVNLLAGVAVIANLALGTNFMYLRRKPVGPTPFDFFGPWPAYLVVLELLVLIVFVALQALLRLRPRHVPVARATPRPPAAVSVARD